MTRGGGTAILDLDGTLAHSVGIDEECYFRVVDEALGAPVPEDWREDPHRTDTSILRRIWTTVRGEPPTTATVAAIEARFRSLLGEAIAVDPTLCRPVRGLYPSVPALLSVRRAIPTITPPMARHPSGGPVA